MPLKFSGQCETCFQIRMFLIRKCGLCKTYFITLECISSQVVDWLAYPEYTLEDDLASFVLAPGLYYTSRLV